MANVIDQQYTNQDNAWALRYSASTNVQLGVRFVPTVSAELSQAIFKLYESGSLASSAVWIELRSDNGSGLPSSTVLATSDSLDPSSWGSTMLEKTFTFGAGNRYLLSSGVTYHLVLVGNYTPSSSNFVGFGNHVSGSYAQGGTESYNGTSWADPEPTTDPYFKQYYDDSTIFSPRKLALMGVGK